MTLSSSPKSGLIFLIALCSLMACKRYAIKKVEHTDYRFEVSDNQLNDIQVEEIVEPYREALEVEMSEVIGFNQFELAKQQPESTLGTFMCDAIFSEASKLYSGDIDFAVVNYGGMRIPFLSAGDIKVGRIFELMPFENYLVVLDLDLATMERLFEQMTGRGGWPMSKNVQMKIDTTNVSYDVLVGGQELGKKRRYKVLISDYIANGGDDCDFLKDAPRETLDILLRDAIIEHLRNTSDTISYQNEGLISYE